MRVLLDTCVLVPEPVRLILLGLAGKGLFVPLWSEKIFEEWEFVVSRNAFEQAEAARIEILLMKSKWSEALISEDVILEKSLMLPDRNDRHVLASAITGKAEILLTDNLKDFPRVILAKYGIIPRSSDSFLLELFTENPEIVEFIIHQVIDSTSEKFFKGYSKKSFLKRYGLSRLAKVVSS